MIKPGSGAAPDSPALVTVIIPAWNASATIDATLDSARRQTHDALEILVVDDGSTDDTVSIAMAHAGADPRIRILRQSNAGVAAARNHGIAQSRGAFIAPLDADDLWAPTKTERQLARFAAGGARTGLVYCGYAVIDEADIVLRVVLPQPEGDVRMALCEHNFVGNGSGAMFRREALVGTSGYEPALRAADAQGCEDHLLYFRTALNWEFGVVKEPLLGYRMTRNSMSSDPFRMQRSHALCLAEFAADFPEGRTAMDRGQARFSRWLLGKAIEFGPWAQMPLFLGQAARHGIPPLPRAIASAFLRRWKARRLRRSTHPPRFPLPG
ncbi:MAG: glycosyltransferase family 2 protein [Sphingobium sp.]